jgi:uncharacterized damage-inducible protein DinB
MDEQERKTHLDTLRATGAKLKAALKGVPKKLLTWTPAPGKWSMLEIVCHMRDMERDAYLARYERILKEDNPALPDIDGDVYALEKDYRNAKLSEVVRDWSRLRKDCLRILAKLRGAEWERVGSHETAGALSVATLLRRHAVGNDQAHLEQIDAIKRRFEILSKLEALPVTVVGLLRGKADDVARRAPRPGKWSAVEIVCHLRDLDRVWTERFTKMAFSERPAFYAVQPDRWAEVLKYKSAEAAPLLKALKNGREDMVSLLRSVPAGSWRRTGLHPKRGEISIEQLAQVVVDHDAKHIEQIKVALS